MRKNFLCLLIFIFVLSLILNSCFTVIDEGENGGTTDSEAQLQTPSESGTDTADTAGISGTENKQETDDKSENSDKGSDIVNTGKDDLLSGNKIIITAAEHKMTATLADNSSARELRALLEDAPITIEMHDYGGFEKVGDLGTSLSRNDEYITTEAGDIILYLGNSITIYYDVNTYTFTRLGKIDGVTKAQLTEILGEGNVTVTFSLS